MRRSSQRSRLSGRGYIVSLRVGVGSCNDLLVGNAEGALLCRALGRHVNFHTGAR
jgi:hypothetical protein